MHFAENIDLVSGTIGGVIIGIASTSFLIVTGKLTGISGIVENFLIPSDDEKNKWSLAYLAGMLQLYGYLLELMRYRTCGCGIYVSRS